MENIWIHLESNKRKYAPGEVLRGKAQWQLDAVPRKATVSLLWYTKGRGTSDMERVNSIFFTPAAAAESPEFSFELPIAPYSFSGKLISVIWAVELAVDRQAVTEEFVMSPYEAEIVLTEVSA